MGFVDYLWMFIPRSMVFQCISMYVICQICFDAPPFWKMRRWRKCNCLVVFSADFSRTIQFRGGRLWLIRGWHSSKNKRGPQLTRKGLTKKMEEKIRFLKMLTVICLSNMANPVINPPHSSPITCLVGGVKTAPIQGEYYFLPCPHASKRALWTYKDTRIQG